MISAKSRLGATWPRKSLKCPQLSNSGNALKLWVPQNGIKAICKRINNRSPPFPLLSISPAHTICGGVLKFIPPLRMGWGFAVTILKMMETEIGNRGSKSIIICPNKQFIHKLVVVVKEQRVDGSWWEKSWFSNTIPPIISQYFSHLRSTLRGFERNYQVSYLSKEIHKYPRALRALSEDFTLHIWFSHVYLCAIKYFELKDENSG